MTNFILLVFDFLHGLLNKLDSLYLNLFEGYFSLLDLIVGCLLMYIIVAVLWKGVKV